MTIQINNPAVCIVIIMLLALSTIVCGIILFVVCRSMKRIRRQLDETNRLLYFNHLGYRNTSQAIVDTQYQMELIYDQLETLSTNLHIHIETEENKSNRKIYPRPDMVKQITSTILEQFDTFWTLSRNLKAPSNDYLDTITMNVMNTYPEIEPQYIINKCIAITQQKLDQIGSE